MKDEGSKGRSSPRPSSLRKRAIAEWRGYGEPRPIIDGHFQAVSALIGKTMAALGLGDRMRETEVVQAWKEVVGPFFAAHSLPSGLRDGVLTVRVLQPTVHFEMDRSKREIVEKLKARFGARVVREVRFRLG